MSLAHCGLFAGYSEAFKYLASYVLMKCQKPFLPLSFVSVGQI